MIYADFFLPLVIDHVCAAFTAAALATCIPANANGFTSAFYASLSTLDGPASHSGYSATATLTQPASVVKSVLVAAGDCLGATAMVG